MYISEKRALLLFEECMDNLYRNSNPSISWEEIKEKYKNKERSEFYMKHCIKQDEYDKIVSQYKKLMTPYYRRKLAWYLLDYSPTICKEGKE